MRKLYALLFAVLVGTVANSQTTLVNSGFEPGDPTVWTLVNSAATNQWFVGSATASTGTNSAYVTNDAGVTNSYSITVASTGNHIYTPVTFPAGETAIILQFDWRNIGEQTTTSFDFIRVSLTTAAPVAGSQTATADQLPVVFVGAGSYTRAWVVIPASYAGLTRNLVFTWRNDGSVGVGTPGPSIDNVLLTSATPAPLTGTKTIQGGGDYTSLSAAIANLNANGVGAGGVTFQIPGGSTFSETPPAITVSGTAANPIVFQKTGAGANPLLTVTNTGNYGPGATGTTNPNGTGDAGFVIAGGDYITFDGIDITSGDYTPGVSIIDYGYKIINASATNGATNNTIQNSTITLNRTNTASAGILQSSGTTGGGVTATSAAGANSTNKYYNISIQNSYFGINLNGGATTAANTDANNEIGTIAGGSTVIGTSYAGTPTGDIGGGGTATYGIQAVNQTSVSIHHTEIRNITATTTIRGIFLDGCQGVSNVYNNKVYGLRNTSTSSTSGVNGMELDLAASGTHTINAYNNFVADITSGYTGAASATRQLKGFLLGSSAATSVYNIDHNSVRIDGSGSPTISSVALEFGSSTPINNVRNNILANFTGAQSGVAKHYAIRSTATAAFGAASSVSDYNDLFIENTTNGFVGLANSVATGGDQATVANWSASMTGNPNTDANSINVPPSYSGAVDLHISPTSNNVDGKGMPLTITTDIDGDARNASTPDLGADEYDVVVGIDVGVTDLIAPVTTGCYTNATTVTVALKNFASTAIDFATNPVTVTVNVTGAATYSSNIVINSGTLAAGATLNVNMPTTLDMSAAGTYTFNASSSVTGDLTPSNDAMVPPATRTVIASEILPQTVDFTGFTGSNLATFFPNWREASGADLPAGTTSGWTSSTIIPGAGTTAKINLDATTDRVWIVGPKFNASANSVLRFDVAITEDAGADPDADGGMASTDDSVIVKISTDCGTTYTDLFVFDASNAGSISNTLTPQSIDLSPYAGQSIIIAFFASEGIANDVPDYDFHLDNIQILNEYPTDVGAVGLEDPSALGCYGATETIAVSIRNHGTATIDFAVNPVTVTTNVTGAATTTLTGTISSGTLAPGATTAVAMSTTLNMTAIGTYTFNAYTTLAADPQASNDSMLAVTRVTDTIVSLPESVDFTGFTGSNLNTVFPNWTEAAGQPLPAGTTSTWVSSTAITGSGTTAKINLDAVSDRAWIIGPKFTATSASRLRFKVAITDFNNGNTDPDGMAGTTSGVPTDDSVIVRISTDCGATYSDLFVFDATNTSGISNSLVEQTIQLGSYAGQNVIIAFYATEGIVNDAPDYDFHIDDINIQNPSPIDAGAVALVAPDTKTCYTNAETVTVQIKNFGSAPLDFAVTPVTVTTNVTGATVATLTGTVSTGTLAVDSSMTVTMSGTLDMSATGNYTFNAYTTVAGDVETVNDTMATVIRTAVAVVAGTISANPATICISGTPTVTLTGNAGGNIQWQESTVSGTGPWTNVGTNSATYTPGSAITATTYYQAVVSCGANSVTTNVDTVDFINPTVTGTTSGSRCGTGTVTLSGTASAGNSLNWYAAASGGTPLGNGNSFTTPSISSTTTYYVAATSGGSTASVGAPNNGATGTYTLDAGLLFTVVAPSVTINGVYIYPIGTGAGVVNIALRNSAGTTLQSLAFNTTGTPSPGIKTFVPLNWTVPAGTDYFLMMTTRTGLVASLIRDGNADIVGGPIASNPAMTLPGVLTITSGRLGTTGTSTSYYYFYDWQVSSGCESPRTAVTATVTPITTLAGTTGGPQVCDMQNVSDNTYTDNSCGAIAKIVPSGASPVSGNVNTCVTIDATVQSYNGSPYLQRHYDIEPANNAATATATVTFYALQSEFDTYNANNGIFPDLPIGPGDATGIGNLRITQFHGTGTAPGNYTGAAQLIDPADANIVWNATNGWWEITINVDGFSGFYIHTTLTGPLPANMLTFSGQRVGNTNQLKWTVAQEIDVLNYEIERSENGRTWSKAGTVASLGNTNAQRSYGFTDNNISGARQFYRLRSVDRSGSHKLSNIVIITGVKPTLLTLNGLFPNPASTQVSLLVDAPARDNVTITVMDAVGRVVKAQKAGVEAGSNTLQINVTGLSQGTYLVKVTSENNAETTVSRFIKE